MSLPAIRNIEAFPAEYQGENLFCLRDPLGYTEQNIFLYPGAFFVAASLDGENDVKDIQEAFAKKFPGRTLAEADLRKVVKYLDEHAFLDTPRFQELRTRVEEEFKTSGVRKAFLAGKSYVEEPDKLKAYLDGQFTREGSPQKKPGASPGQGPPLKLLIAPHIDLERGGHSYAHAYLKLFESGRPDLVFIFGVAHMAPPHPFVLTRKDFETPLGTLKTDRAVVERLEKACTWHPYAYEILHRTEHSIEFQALMLAYLYGPDVRIVPILCGAFTPGMSLIKPRDRADITTFLKACREEIATAGGRASVIAAADLAHVGRRFGDNFEVTDKVTSQIETRDREDLDRAAARAPDDFYDSVMKDQNARRVCGLNCIYSGLSAAAIREAQAELLHYGSAPDPQGGVVSFAAMSFG